MNKKNCRLPEMIFPCTTFNHMLRNRKYFNTIGRILLTEMLAQNYAQHRRKRVHRAEHRKVIQRTIASPSFFGGTMAFLFPGKALRETSTRALKLYGSCIDSSDKTFLFSCTFSFISPCMKFP